MAEHDAVGAVERPCRRVSCELPVTQKHGSPPGTLSRAIPVSVPLWADRLSRAADLSLVASAAAATRSALDALDRGDVELARRYWSGVDGEVLLKAWDDQVIAMRGITPEPIRRPSVENPIQASGRLSRSLSTAVFRRDGYRCAYCGIPVVTQWKSGDIPRLVTTMPDLAPGLRIRDGSLIGSGRAGALANIDQAKWLWLTASADHVVPASRFGPTTLENLLTACAGCNYGKMDWTLEQLDVADPRPSA